MKRAPQPFDLAVTASIGGRHCSFLRDHILRARPLIRTRLRELSIALVGDARMSRLHERFMNIAGPTDVLTFPMEEDEQGRATSGEVVICVPEARRQALLRGIPIEHELLLYAIHGILHLSGFDDRTDAQYRRMHRMEDRILSRLGIGPTFAPGKRSSAARPSRRKGAK